MKEGRRKESRSEQMTNLYDRECSEWPPAELGFPEGDKFLIMEGS